MAVRHDDHVVLCLHTSCANAIHISVKQDDMLSTWTQLHAVSYKTDSRGDPSKHEWLLRYHHRPFARDALCYLAHACSRHTAYHSARYVTGQVDKKSTKVSMKKCRHGGNKRGKHRSLEKEEQQQVHSKEHQQVKARRRAAGADGKKGKGERPGLS